MGRVHMRGRPIAANPLPSGTTGHQKTPTHSRPVGIKDIAKALGLSNGTVDRALHSRGGINPRTKDRVLKMARTLGYKPNLAARYLKAPRQVRLSVNLPAKIASFFDSVRAGIIEASGPFEAGVALCFRSHPTLGEADEALFEQALADESKGIIIAPGHPATLKPWIHRAGQRGVPVVCVATDAPGTDRLTCVSADPFISGGLVGELLSRMAPSPGAVAVMTGDLSTFDHAEKVRGFKNSLHSIGSPLVLSTVLESHDDENAAYEQTRDLVEKERQLKAIYVSTANSIGVIRALEELDPECRLAVITTDLFPQIVPFVKSGRILATIHQRPEAQGRLSFEALYNFLVEGKRPPTRINLNPHVVMRSNLDLFLERMSRAVPGDGRQGIKLL
jgi:LacI family transcriptional regulator